MGLTVTEISCQVMNRFDLAASIGVELQNKISEPSKYEVDV